VTETTAMSRTGSVSADFRNPNQKIRTFTNFDSTKTTATTWNNNTVTTWSFPNLATGREEWGADPRFGFESPLTKLAQLTLQGGRVIKQSEAQTVSPAWDASVDPIAALGQLQTLTTSASRTGTTTETASSTFTKSTKTALVPLQQPKALGLRTRRTLFQGRYSGVALSQGDSTLPMISSFVLQLKASAAP